MFPVLYTCPTRIREAGVDADLPNERLWAQINWISAAINKLTGQFFQPYETTTRVDGRDSSIVGHRALVPIIKLAKLTIYDTDHNPGGLRRRRMWLPQTIPLEDADVLLAGAIVDADAYRVADDRRTVELLAGRFPDGRQNVEMDGVFGWMEDVAEASTTTTTDINDASTSVTLDSVDGIYFDDTLDITDTNDNQVRLWVLTVDVTTKEITFDKVNWIRGTVLSGATVKRYGRVPRGVERIALRMVELQAVNSAAPTTGRIRSEKVDEYSISFFGPEDIGISVPLVGDSLVGALLEEYSAPPSWRWV